VVVQHKLGADLVTAGRHEQPNGRLGRRPGEHRVTLIVDPVVDVAGVRLLAAPRGLECEV
jgi:hypothetical protein